MSAKLIPAKTIINALRKFEQAILSIDGVSRIDMHPAGDSYIKEKLNDITIAVYISVYNSYEHRWDRQWLYDVLNELSSKFTNIKITGKKYDEDLYSSEILAASRKDRCVISIIPGLTIILHSRNMSNYVYAMTLCKRANLWDKKDQEDLITALDRAISVPYIKSWPMIKLCRWITRLQTKPSFK